MGIRSFRMFESPPPTPQFRGLRSQKPAVGSQARRGRVTLSRLLGHQLSLILPISKPTLPRPVWLRPSSYAPLHHCRASRSPVRSHSPGLNLPRPTDTRAQLRLPPPSPPQLTVDWSPLRNVISRRHALANQRALLWLTRESETVRKAAPPSLNRARLWFLTQQTLECRIPQDTYFLEYILKFFSFTEPRRLRNRHPNASSTPQGTALTQHDVCLPQGEVPLIA
jgi:hypothetical protein